MPEEYVDADAIGIGVLPALASAGAWVAVLLTLFYRRHTRVLPFALLPSALLIDYVVFFYRTRVVFAYRLTRAMDAVSLRE